MKLRDIAPHAQDVAAVSEAVGTDSRRGASEAQTPRMNRGQGHRNVTAKVRAVLDRRCERERPACVVLCAVQDGRT